MIFVCEFRHNKWTHSFMHFTVFFKPHLILKPWNLPLWQNDRGNKHRICPVLGRSNPLIISLQNRYLGPVENNSVLRPEPTPRSVVYYWCLQCFFAMCMWPTVILLSLISFPKQVLDKSACEQIGGICLSLVCNGTWFCTVFGPFSKQTCRKQLAVFHLALVSLIGFFVAVT